MRTLEDTVVGHMNDEAQKHVVVDHPDHVI